MTVKEALQRAAARLAAHQLVSPRQDAALLLATVLGCDQAFLYSYPERRLTPAEEACFEDWLGKRAAHYPLQYLRGHQEFFGRRFWVCPGVFIPRPETELLVEIALARIRARATSPARLADIGTGSGCIGITLACEEPHLQVTATDSSELALQVARTNAQEHGCPQQIQFLHTTSVEPLREKLPGYDLVVCNPPYVSSLARDQVDPSVQLYEPAEAIFAGQSGLEAYRALFPEVGQVLRPDGFLVLELGHRQAPEVRRLGEKAGWALVDLRKDLAGIDRCAVFSPRG